MYSYVLSCLSNHLEIVVGQNEMSNYRFETNQIFTLIIVFVGSWKELYLKLKSKMLRINNS